MDSQIKTGKVFLRPHKANKKWKEVWLTLISPSSSRGGQLELRSVAGGGPGGDLGTVVRRYQSPGDRKVKVIQLSEILNILRLPPNAEACPMENMSAFCVETQDKTLVFAALRDESVDWVEKLVSSQRAVGVGALQMEENQIYASTAEDPLFWVVVQRTDAAIRSNLQGSYWLQVEPQVLLLKEPENRKTVRAWPYELLRRYGSDEVVFTIETGRRCDCGPGTFSFETRQAEKIFSLIQNNIKHKSSTGNQTQEPEKVTGTSTMARSPLPSTPGGTTMASHLEHKPRTQGWRSPLVSRSAKTLEDSGGLSDGAPAPITLMPLPLVPTAKSNHSTQSEAIYANPTICVPSVPQPITAQYVDPASILPVRAPLSGEPNPPSTDPHPGLHDSVYSEVYDKISLDQNLLLGSRNTCMEPIYSEPVSSTDTGPEARETKPDPFAHLYAQVCKASSRTSTTSASPPSIAIRTKASPDETSDDVIYENLGVV
nr:docking protein 1 [Nothobranchius furzeri]